MTVNRFRFLDACLQHALVARGTHQDLQMSSGRRLGHPELVGDEEAADPILNQVAVSLRRKVGDWILEPSEDLHPSFIGQGLNDLGNKHGGSMAMCESTVQFGAHAAARASISSSPGLSRNRAGTSPDELCGT
jgi:hypothetical protein